MDGKTAKQVELWKEWVDSEEVATRADPTTLGAKTDQRQYLENRLILSYNEGVENGMKIATPDLVMLVGRLARKCTDEDLRDKAMRYLRNMGLMPSPLRTETK